MITISSFELGMKRYHDIMAVVAEQDKQLLRDHNKACADAIEALAKGHVRHAHHILSAYFDAERPGDAQEAE